MRTTRIRRPPVIDPPTLVFLSPAMTIAVIDYGMGNLRSVAKALHHVAPERTIVVSADPDVIRAAERVVLPGQSAMPDCIRLLHAFGLVDTVREVLLSRPFLGICLGMQMLFEMSEEGPTEGLSLIPGTVVRFRDGAMTSPDGKRLKVPHMGWSPVHQARKHRLWDGIAAGTRFYFAHSYHPVPADAPSIAGTADYPAAFTCAIARDNIFATQFHP